MTIPIRFVDHVANGTHECDASGRLVIKMVKATTNVQEFINFVYPDLEKGIACTDGMALLTLRNAEVDLMNDKVTSSLKGAFTSLFSQNELDTSTEHAGRSYLQTKNSTS